MRFLDRIISFAFSIIMLIVSIVLILIGVGVVEPSTVLEIISIHALNKEILAQGIFNAITIAGIVLLILSLKTTVFLSLFKVRSRAPISVKTKNGEIQITQDTIINTAKNATLEFENVREAQAYMRKKARGVKINEIIQVYVNTNIRDLTTAIQESVKNIVYATTGVNVIDVNIRVKNVYKGSKKEETASNVEPKVELKPQPKEEIVMEAIPVAIDEGNAAGDDAVSHLPNPEVIKSEDESTSNIEE